MQDTEFLPMYQAVDESEASEPAMEMEAAAPPPNAWAERQLGLLLGGLAEGTYYNPCLTGIELQPPPTASQAGLAYDSGGSTEGSALEPTAVSLKLDSAASTAAEEDASLDPALSILRVHSAESVEHVAPAVFGVIPLQQAPPAKADDAGVARPDDNREAVGGGAAGLEGMVEGLSPALQKTSRTASSSRTSKKAGSSKDKRAKSRAAKPTGKASGESDSEHSPTSSSKDLEGAAARGGQARPKAKRGASSRHIQRSQTEGRMLQQPAVTKKKQQQAAAEHGKRASVPSRNWSAAAAASSGPSPVAEHVAWPWQRQQQQQQPLGPSSSSQESSTSSQLHRDVIALPLPSPLLDNREPGPSLPSQPPVGDDAALPAMLDIKMPAPPKRPSIDLSVPPQLSSGAKAEASSDAEAKAPPAPDASGGPSASPTSSQPSDKTGTLDKPKVSGRRDSSVLNAMKLSKLKGKIKAIMNKKKEEESENASPLASSAGGKALAESHNSNHHDLSRRPSQADSILDMRHKTKKRQHNLKIKLNDDMMHKIRERAMATKQIRAAGILSPVGGQRTTAGMQMGPEVEEMVDSYVAVVCDEDFAKKGTHAAAAALCGVMVWLTDWLTMCAYLCLSGAQSGPRLWEGRWARRRRSASTSSNPAPSSGCDGEEEQQDRTPEAKAVKTLNWLCLDDCTYAQGHGAAADGGVDRLLAALPVSE